MIWLLGTSQQSGFFCSAQTLVYVGYVVEFLKQAYLHFSKLVCVKNRIEIQKEKRLIEYFDFSMKMLYFEIYCEFYFFLQSLL